MINEQLLDTNSASEHDPTTKKVLEKYFAYNYQDRQYRDYKHLKINYVDFCSYNSNPGETDTEEKNTIFTNRRYISFYEKINRAHIYPGEYTPKIKKEKLERVFFASSFYLIFYFILLIFMMEPALLIIFYIIGVLAFSYFTYSLGLFSIKKFDAQNINKLKRILNAKPIIQLYFKKDFLYEVQYHSYADLSRLNCVMRGNMIMTCFCDETFFYDIFFENVNLNNNTYFLDFPTNYIFFVDSTREYFKFLILQFNKYCYLALQDEDIIYENMYIKFSLQTEEGEIIYRNDPFFFTTFTNMNIILYRFLLVFGIITLLIPVFFTIFK